MESGHLSRRSLLHALAAAVGGAALPFSWADVVRAADDAHAAHQAGKAQPASADGALACFTVAEAADVEAVAAQIVPSDGTPGAREAGVVRFIDRALATFFSQLAVDYRAQLAAFQATARDRHPGAASFATLSSEEQIAHLKTVDRTPFFETTRILTLLGLFTLPSYGGNRDGVGWTLLGFEDAHVFRPPFGYYDRDYPGFAIDTGHSK
jgi:gluconate 2-dehydrogenase subunit 3-like protein